MMGWMKEAEMRLQWGRDLSVAETRSQATRVVAAAMLQWGRDLSVAETGRRPDVHGVISRFNGAATFQSRKP